MQAARQVITAASYSVVDRPLSEKKLVQRERMVNIFNMLLVVFAVIWITIGAFQAVNDFFFVSEAIVSWVVYFLVVAVIVAGLFLGEVYVNKLKKMRYFFYEEVLEGLIVGLVFDNEGKHASKVRVIVEGANRAGQVRREATAINVEKWRKSTYVIGRKLSF